MPTSPLVFGQLRAPTDADAPATRADVREYVRCMLDDVDASEKAGGNRSQRLLDHGDELERSYAAYLSEVDQIKFVALYREEMQASMQGRVAKMTQAETEQLRVAATGFTIAHGLWSIGSLILVFILWRIFR